MDEQGAIFSESWHRVAALKVHLRSSVQVRRQYFRGEKWFVLHDPFANSFTRFRPAVWEFLARLRPDRTVQEAWDECLESAPEQPPTQPEVIRLLSQLYQANLLQSDLPPDSAKLLERKERREARMLAATLKNILFLKIPLWDPDPFLRRIVPSLKWLVSSAMGIVWLLVVLSGLVVVAQNWSQMKADAADVFAPDQLIALYGAFLITKAVHEFGHAFVCRALGGEVHRLGVMLFLFSPMPYVDATASWAFRSRRQRILVGAAGMIFELFIAALAAYVWASTGPGALHRFAANVMFVASVSTVLFNINPLIRFDGYYILSDLLDVPNLAQRATTELKHIFERYICGSSASKSIAATASARWGFASYGLASGLYRIFISYGIVLIIASYFFGIGLVLALVFAVAAFIVPVFKFSAYVARGASLSRVRGRACAVTFGALASVIAFLALAPMPNRFTAPGVVEAENYRQIFTPTDGFIAEEKIAEHNHVAKGADLVGLANPELDMEIAALESQLQEIKELQRTALSESIASAEPLRQRLVSVEQKLGILNEQRGLLRVTSPMEGEWVAPHQGQRSGRWLQRGEPLGEIVTPGAFRFSAVVAQDEAAALFGGQMAGAEVRIKGQGGISVPVKITRIVPAQQDELPSAALGWQSGGDVAVTNGDDSGRRTAEPFFKVIATFGESHALLFHRRTGVIRFELPDEPLLQQWWRKGRQLLQKRYRV
jgi:putative peptide zinc metalloprotease protein